MTLCILIQAKVIYVLFLNLRPGDEDNIQVIPSKVYVCIVFPMCGQGFGRGLHTLCAGVYTKFVPGPTVT